MDIIIEWIVRLMVWLSSPRFIGTSGFGALLSRLGIVRYEKWQPGNIGIQMEGQLPEHIRVTRCFFSQHYPSSTCAIASLMDRGIIEGLCGRGQLVFSERITKGQPCCICHLKTSVTV